MGFAVAYAFSDSCITRLWDLRLNNYCACWIKLLGKPLELDFIVDYISINWISNNGALTFQPPKGNSNSASRVCRLAHSNSSACVVNLTNWAIIIVITLLISKSRASLLSCLRIDAESLLVSASCIEVFSRFDSVQLAISMSKVNHLKGFRRIGRK